MNIVLERLAFEMGHFDQTLSDVAMMRSSPYFLPLR